MAGYRPLYLLTTLLTGAFLCSAAAAQSNGITELGGARVPPAGSASAVTNARFAIGITTDNGVSWRSSVVPTETLRIVGRVQPEATHIGQAADLYLLVKDGAVVLMRRTDGGFEQWNRQLSGLLPFQQQAILVADTDMTLYAGQLGVSGQFELFLGYRGPDGVLHYSAAPYVLNSSAGQPGTATTWLFNGSAWQASGTPGACPSPLVQAPLDLSKVTSILYPGQTRGGDYKAHGGFRLDGAGQTSQVNVTAPIAGSVVRGARYIEHGVVQYLFDVIHPCGLMMRMDHLLTLSPKFAAIADTLRLHSRQARRVAEILTLRAVQVHFATKVMGFCVMMDAGFFLAYGPPPSCSNCTSASKGTAGLWRWTTCRGSCLSASSRRATMG